MKPGAALQALSSLSVIHSVSNNFFKKLNTLLSKPFELQTWFLDRMWWSSLGEGMLLTWLPRIICNGYLFLTSSHELLKIYYFHWLIFMNYSNIKPGCISTPGVKSNNGFELQLLTSLKSKTLVGNPTTICLLHKRRHTTVYSNSEENCGLSKENKGRHGTEPWPNP